MKLKEEDKSQSNCSTVFTFVGTKVMIDERCRGHRKRKWKLGGTFVHDMVGPEGIL